MTASQFTARFVADASALGVHPGDTVLVHSSLKSFGHVPGGAATVVDALLAAIGSEGTLLMPALSYERVTRTNPDFDVRHTPSNVGLIPETFRTRSGTARSLHPTHSVCGAGPLAGELLGGHERDSTPCGPNSPFRTLPDRGGRILMLGCGLRPNTSVHAIEELLEPPYLFGEPITYTLVDRGGISRRKRYRTHGFAGCAQRYERVETLLAEPELTRGTICGASSHLVDAKALRRAVLGALRLDPFALVERVPPPDQG